MTDVVQFGPDAPWQPVIYAELRLMASRFMKGERLDHPFDPTELVHETWLRLVRSRNAEGLRRGEFLGVAAQAMRRILTECVRERERHKRGGGWRRTTLSGKSLPSDPAQVLVDVDAALEELSRLDFDLARLVELRFYANCSTEEIAQQLAMSPRTVKRRWRFARAWLHQRLSKEEA